jgi:hypothetical protein
LKCVDLEVLAGNPLQDRLDILNALRLELGVLCEHGLLGRLEYTVEAAEHNQGQDDPAVLRLLVVATQ